MSTGVRSVALQPLSTKLETERLRSRVDVKAAHRLMAPFLIARPVASPELRLRGRKRMPRFKTPLLSMTLCGLLAALTACGDDETPTRLRTVQEADRQDVHALAAPGLLYRINVGGPALPDGWSADSSASPSPYVNSADTNTFQVWDAIGTSDPSLPAGTPAGIFQTERWDPLSEPEMHWNLPVQAGNYEVRLYFAEIYTGAMSAGARTFDVFIEGQTVLQDFDVYAAAGANNGIMRSFEVAADASLDIVFGHKIENPALKALEVLTLPAEPCTACTLEAAPTLLDFGSVPAGDSATLSVALSNPSAESVTIESVLVSGTGASAFSAGSPDTATVAPGRTAHLTVTFAPASSGAYDATLQIAYNSDASPLLISLTGQSEGAWGMPIYRVNAGGPAVEDWAADTATAPSPYGNAAETGNTTYATANSIDMSDPSIPAGTPMTLFQTERWDGGASPEMTWSFPVVADTYRVRLYFADIYVGTQAPGARVFSVAIEGQTVLADYDIAADVGGDAGVVHEFTVVADSSIDITLLHNVENPAIKAIEILPPADQPGYLSPSPSSIDFGDVDAGGSASKFVLLMNTGAQPLTVTDVQLVGSDPAFSLTSDPSGTLLDPGASVFATVTFTPGAIAPYAGTLYVTHDGENGPLNIPLAGNGVDIIPVGFGKSALQGAAAGHPSSLQFGPDGRLYVADFTGIIHIYTVDRAAANSYTVIDQETIDSIYNMPNHNDDGSPNPGVTSRLVTGILVAGTALNPVIYVTSSDPRIGAGPDGTDLNLDTNSGVLSRLTWTGTTWTKLDLVRGLPRSEENHTANGMTLDATGQILYIAHGGNTNKGAPSHNFAKLPEYAYAAAILSVDLAAIGNTTYDLPTLDDEDRPGINDENDPFGGNDGKNQAVIVPGGPVQVYAPGFRNPYDIVLTESGQLYTIDNGPNGGWGEVPVNEGPGGNCTNEVNEPGSTVGDSLHYISGPGYYGGHPNPTRGNSANMFNLSNPQSPVPTSNPIECDYLMPWEAGSLTTFPSSTNGLAEYTASNFGGAMKGDLLAAGYVYNTIYRIERNASGTAIVSDAPIFSSVGQNPLDVTALGDDGIFPGTIWVADLATGIIHVFEPNDYETGGATCSGVDDPGIDEDGDGYSNADEIDNGTSPCSSADVPADWDNDLVSDLNDPDDDNDGLADIVDPFAIDPANGMNTWLPVEYTWENDAPNPGGLLNLGYTGLMSNGVDDYATLFDKADITAGGAAGVLTVDAVPAGDALGSANSQQYGFQFGVHAAPSEVGVFTARTRIVGPFNGVTPEGNQSLGLFIGTGDQDNYVKVVVTANGGSGGIQALKEIEGQVSGTVTHGVALPGPDYVDLYLTVDPALGTVQPWYTVTAGGVTGTPVTLGAALTVPPGWFTAATGLAVGILSTSGGPATFPGTWDFMQVYEEQSQGATVANDTFTRTVAGGWGLADVGGPWSVLGGPTSALSVDGNKGGVQATAGDGERLLQLGTTTVSDPDAKVTVSWSALPQGGGGNFAYLVIRRQSSGAYFRVGVWVDANGQVFLRGQRQDHSFLFADVGPLLTVQANEPVTLRIQAEGASPTTLRAKAWKTGTQETAWAVESQDSTTGLQQAGTFGIRVINTSSISAAVHFDDLVVIDPDASITPTWQSLAAAGLERHEVSYVAVNGKLHLLGGRNTLLHEVYDPATDTWTTAASLPTELHHAQAVATGGKIYVIGALAGPYPDHQVSTVYIYDPLANTWSQGASFLSGRARGSSGAAVYQGSIYVAGGLQDTLSGTGHEGAPVALFDVYHPASNAWQSLPDMPRARNHFHAAVHDGKLYAIGGRVQGNDFYATIPEIDVYDFGSGTWSTLNVGLPTQRAGAMTVLVGGEVLVLGGEGHGQAYATVEAFDPATLLWRTLPEMPEARHGTQAIACGSSVYIAAGAPQQGGLVETNRHDVLHLGAPGSCSP